MVSFQAKIGWKRMRKRENKNFHSVPFCSYRTRKRKFQKNSKKNSKNLEIPLWHHFNPKQVGKCRERENIKRIVLFRSYPTRNRKFQKKFKNLKNAITASFQAKIGWKMPRSRKNKNYRSVPFLHDE